MNRTPARQSRRAFLISKIQKRKVVAMSKIIKTGKPITATVVTIPPTTAPHVTTKRIGGTTYQVVVHFSKTSKETISDKISRIIQRETFIGKAAGQ